MLNRPFLVAALAMVLLVAATAVAFTAVPRYEPDGRELLSNGTFADDIDDWRLNPGSGEISATDGIVTLRNGDPNGFVGLRQPVTIDDPPAAVGFSADVSSQGILGGTDPSHAGRVYLILQREFGNRDLVKYHVLSQITGGHDWTRQSATIPLNDHIESISVNIQLRHSTGVLAVRHPSLIPLQARSGFTILRSVLLAAWVLVLAWTVRAFLVHSKNPLAGRLGVVGLLVLLAGVFSPEFAREQLLGVDSFQSVGAAAIDVFSEWGIPGTDDADPGKTGVSFFENMFHFTMFFALAILVLLADPTRSLALQAIWLALFAGGTEVLQFFTEDREPSVLDWVVDMAGVGVAYSCASMVRLRTRGRNERPTR